MKNNPNLLQVKGDGVTLTSIMSSLYEVKLYGNSMDHKGQLWQFDKIIFKNENKNNE